MIRLNVLLRRAVQLLLGAGILVTVLLYDPRAAIQTFREPQMTATLALGAWGAVLWGLTALFPGRRILPVAPFFVFIPLAGLFLCRLWLDWSHPVPGLDLEGSLPIKVHFRIHILLPVLSWIVTAALSSAAIRKPALREKIALFTLIALSLETTVVILEIISNQLGVQVYPVAWNAEIDLMGQVVKERIFGTIGNPNFVAGYLVIAALPALGWTLSRRTRVPKVIGSLVLAAVLLAVVSTRSKGGLLALAVGLIHFGVVWRMARRGRQGATGSSRKAANTSRRVLLAVGLVLIIAAGWLLADATANPSEGSYLGRWMETLHFRGDSVAVRALLADCGFRMWRQSPAIGLGAGEFKIQFLDNLRKMTEGPDADLYAGRIARLHSLRASHLHNEYLQVLVEWGALGLILVELFLVWCEVRAVQGILCSPSPRDRLIRLGMLSGFWAALGGSLIDMPFHRPPQVYLLAILLGACLPMPASKFGIPDLRIRRGRVVSLVTSVILLPLGVWMLWQANLRYVAIRDVFWAQAVLSGKLAGGDTAKAGETIRKAIARVPGEGEYQCSLAEFLVHAGVDSGPGVAQIRRSRLLSDRPELYLLEARAQIERNNLEAAEPILVFMESLDRESPELHYLKGRAAQQAGHTHSARSSYLSAINFSEMRTPFKPDLQDAYLRLARILEELGETGEAVKYYEKFLASLEGQTTSYPIAELSLARMYRDNFYDYDLADKYYQQALAVFKRQGNAKEIRRIEQDLEAMRERIAHMK